MIAHVAWAAEAIMQHVGAQGGTTAEPEQARSTPLSSRAAQLIQDVNMTLQNIVTSKVSTFVLNPNQVDIVVCSR